MIFCYIAVKTLNETVAALYNVTDFYSGECCCFISNSAPLCVNPAQLYSLAYSTAHTQSNNKIFFLLPVSSVSKMASSSLCTELGHHPFFHPFWQLWKIIIITSFCLTQVLSFMYKRPHELSFILKSCVSQANGAFASDVVFRANRQPRAGAPPRVHDASRSHQHPDGPERRHSGAGVHR